MAPWVHEIIDLIVLIDIIVFIYLIVFIDTDTPSRPDRETLGITNFVKVLLLLSFHDNSLEQIKKWKMNSKPSRGEIQ